LPYIDATRAVQCGARSAPRLEPDYLLFAPQRDARLHHAVLVVCDFVRAVSGVIGGDFPRVEGVVFRPIHLQV